MTYNVWYKADKAAKYVTLAQARKVANEIFEKTGIVVAITESA